jgi:hypothetical protein
MQGKPFSYPAKGLRFHPHVCKFDKGKKGEITNVVDLDRTNVASCYFTTTLWNYRHTASIAQYIKLI